MKYLKVEFNNRNEARYFENAVFKYYTFDKIEKENGTEFYVKCDKIEITGIKSGLVYLFFDLGKDSFSVALSVKSIIKLNVYDIWHSKRKRVKL